MIQLVINGKTMSVMDGMTVAAALAQAKTYSRRSVRGEQRTAFCGMGVCQECRVKINGLRVLACQTLCQQGMQVETQ